MEKQIINNQLENSFNETEKKVDMLIEEIKSLSDQSHVKHIDWWNKIPKNQRFKFGDVVFIDEFGKYGIIDGPAKKEGLLKIFILKKDLSKGFYNRKWYIPIDKVELVRRRTKMQKNFLCVYNKIYKLQK